MKAIEYLVSRQWAMRPDVLDLGVAICLRENAPQAVQAREGRPVDGTEGVTRRGSVALIDVVGPIFRYANFFTYLCGGATVEGLAKDLTKALDDPSISAVVLHFDSPGGEAAGIGELADLIAEGTARKPVVAYVSADACSAALWLASACSEVVCAEASFLGSIGVVAAYPTKRDDPRQVEFVSSQSPDKRPDVSTEGGKAVVQRWVDDLASVFIAAVAANRDMTVEKVQSLAGGILVGQKAVDFGLADRIGSLESVIAELNDGGRVGSGRAKTLTSERKDDPMSWNAKTLKAWFTSGMPENFDPSAAANDGAGAATPPAQAQAQPQASGPTRKDLDEANRQLALLKVETFQLKAENFYNALFAANLIVPAERDPLIGAFVQASIDDMLSPLAEGKTRVSLVQDVFKARTAHTLDKEQLAKDGTAPASASNLPAGHKVVTDAADPNAPVKPERTRELLGHLVRAGLAPPDVLNPSK